MFNFIHIPSNRTIEAVTWQNRVIAAGGGFESNSLIIVNNLARVLHSRSYYSKIKYLLPMLGKGIGAARVPLVDSLNVGAAANTNFLDADFSQSTGLQGNGSTKYLDSLIKPDQLGTTNNGGLGWWENNISFGVNVEPMGCYDSAASPSANRFVIDLRATQRGFRWGQAANGASELISAANGHFYGQRASNVDRKCYFNGSQFASNTTADSATEVSVPNIYIVGSNESGTIAPWPGRCAVAYLTDGTLTAGEIADFDSVLRNYLLGPTGKSMS